MVDVCIVLALFVSFAAMLISLVMDIMRIVREDKEVNDGVQFASAEAIDNTEDPDGLDGFWDNASVCCQRGRVCMTVMMVMRMMMMVMMMRMMRMMRMTMMMV